MDHKAAYLNASMSGPPVNMILTDILCEIDQRSRLCEKFNGRLSVQLKKALYGCIESALLWYKELKTTLNEIIFTNKPYDISSFTRTRRNGEGG